ncbi:MAG TPA: NBR1-Ig-like domain-containing protein [Anaerolineales bacterium]|nr:NBR1-Ig-like domain-containing protein [Anaerolineales bacterium]
MRAGSSWKGITLFPLLIILAACRGAVNQLFPEKPPEEIYRPPSISASSTPSHLPLLDAIQTTPTLVAEEQPTPTCVNNLLFLEDLTVPDGTLVPPGSVIDKRWSVENNGTCNWDERFRLKLVAGSEIGAQVEQALYPARSGTQATIRILYTAPQEPGTYRSAWQAFSPEGQPFGDPIFIEVIVESSDNE